MKEGPVYNLVIDKSGLRMEANNSGQELKSPISGSKTTGKVTGTRGPMEYLCWWLAPRIGLEQRPVIDKTGLNGFYDFTLTYRPELPADYDVNKLPPGIAELPSIFAALKEQLGLRLEAHQGLVENFVIDGAEKPSQN